MLKNISQSQSTTNIQQEEYLNSNYYLFNNIRVFATISVIIGHASNPLMRELTSFNKAEWWIGNLFVSFFLSGLPLFIILSGVLLFDKSEKPGFYIARFKRIFIPFLFWNIIYGFINNIFDYSKGLDNTLNLFTTNSYHFWFVYVILILYIFFPILSFFIKKNKNKTLLYATLFYLLLNICYIFYNQIYPSSILFNFLFHAIIYSYHIVVSVIAFKWILQKSFKAGTVLYLFGFLISLFGTYFILNMEGFENVTLHKSFNAHLLLKAFGAIIIIKYLTNILGETVNRHTSRVSKYCFGIYFIHVLVLNKTFIKSLPISYNFSHHFILIGLNSIICFSVSLFIIYLLSKLPFGKYLF
ncbi:acyltransferase [Nibribacter koreensis]|uniref:Acyltransferase family protein n=1 Tax=Nibribacter koreensis TaxID=1084519 RepID=A0ABP8FA15_9BACT